MIIVNGIDNQLCHSITLRHSQHPATPSMTYVENIYTISPLPGQEAKLSTCHQSEYNTSLIIPSSLPNKFNHPLRNNPRMRPSNRTLLSHSVHRDRKTNLDFNGNQFFDQIPDFDGHKRDPIGRDRRLRMMIILGKKILSNSRTHAIKHHDPTSIQLEPQVCNQVDMQPRH